MVLLKRYLSLHMLVRNCDRENCDRKIEIRPANRGVTC